MLATLNLKISVAQSYRKYDEALTNSVTTHTLGRKSVYLQAGDSVVIERFKQRSAIGGVFKSSSCFLCFQVTIYDGLPVSDLLLIGNSYLVAV